MVDQVVAVLRTALGDRLVAVVLFSPRARGEAREDSDKARWPTPWELFDRAKAYALFGPAEEAGRLLRQVIEQGDSYETVVSSRSPAPGHPGRQV